MGKFVVLIAILPFWLENKLIYQFKIFDNFLPFRLRTLQNKKLFQKAVAGEVET